jgi:hypothetical protein
MAAYLVAIFLYRHNDDADDDNTARRYMRWVEGEEESWVASVGGGPTSRWLRNKGCVLYHEATTNVILETRWCKLSLPLPT